MYLPDNWKLNKIHTLKWFPQFDIAVMNDIFPVMIKDSLTTSHPVSTQITDPEDIHQFFDEISYNKVRYKPET